MEKASESIHSLKLIMAVIAAMTGISSQGQFLNTFDSSNSITAGIHNLTPPPTGVFFSSGTATSSSVVWSPLDRSNNPGSGSVMLSWTAGTASFTFDIFSVGEPLSFYNLSFDIMFSAAVPTPAGYFPELEMRSPNYNYVRQYFQPIQRTVGVWQHLSYHLSSGEDDFHAITLQDIQFGSTIDPVNGSETFNIDNLQITPTVPEPGTFALVGFGIAGVLVRNRRGQMKQESKQMFWRKSR